MKLLDVNILVQAHREDEDRHVAVKSWLHVPPGGSITSL